MGIKSLQSRPALAVVITQVCGTAAKVDRETVLRARGDRGGWARPVAMAWELCGLGLGQREIGREFGVDPDAVSKGDADGGAEKRRGQGWTGVGAAYFYFQGPTSPDTEFWGGRWKRRHHAKPGPRHRPTRAMTFERKGDPFKATPERAVISMRADVAHFDFPVLGDRPVAWWLDTQGDVVACTVAGRSVL